VIPILQQGEAWEWLDSHGQQVHPELSGTVQRILEDVKTLGDKALHDLATRFGDSLTLSLSSEEVEKQCEQLEPDIKELLERVASRVEGFARAIAAPLKDVSWSGEGYRAGQRFEPVESVGCYVPGGRYPLPSTALMTTIPARVAGVKHLSLTCPTPNPAVLYAGKLAGVKHFYTLGGAQAVAAFAYGTEEVLPVDMVVGPGNAYVTEAKRQLQGVIGIDMLAGPSEVAIIADSEADPVLIAHDLLAQAEHDPMARVCLITDSHALAESVLQSIVTNDDQKPDFIEKSLGGSALLVLKNMDRCVKASNQFAAEHLQVFCTDRSVLKRLTHYGALFVGPLSGVPLGDYGAGPNHTLPTGRAARYSSGLSPLTFLRTQSWLELTEPCAELMDDTVRFAQLEGLHLHAAAMTARRES